MNKLKLAAIPDDKPVKVTVDLPAPIFRDLQTYATIIAQTAGETTPPDPTKLIAPMLQRFMATDKGFRAAKNQRRESRQ